MKLPSVERRASPYHGNGDGHSNELPTIGHFLVATRLASSECESIEFAIRMANKLGAEVTFLHVIPPIESESTNWLDAIEHLHRAVCGQPRTMVAAIERGRASIRDFLQNEIPESLRQGVVMHCECRVGDVATEVARFADEKKVALVFVCERPSGWHPLLSMSVSQRIARLNSRPIVMPAARSSKLKHRIES